MKTAMQLLFEEFESLSKASRDSGDTQTSGLIDFLCERKTVALEKEKEQIVNDYINGKANGYDAINRGVEYNIIGEDYYNQTYNQNK